MWHTTSSTFRKPPTDRRAARRSSPRTWRSTDAAGGNADGTACQGLWGTVNMRDLMSASGKVGDWNHAFYVQDAWTVAKGLTLNLGLRLDKENLPSYNTPARVSRHQLRMGPEDCSAPGRGIRRAAQRQSQGVWQLGILLRHHEVQPAAGQLRRRLLARLRVRAGYPDYNADHPAARFAGPLLPGGRRRHAGGRQLPARMRFIENYDYREPANDPNQIGTLGKTGLVDPNLKPMKQHVMTFGAAWEIKHDLVFEPVYTRTRLDRTIEDAGTITQNGEVYYIANPGFGVNSTVPNCNGCPPNPKAVRNYDGIEFRLTKRFSHQWFGAFSYTYSRLYGNYDGLTSTDISDCDRPQRRQHRPRVRRAVHAVRCARQGDQRAAGHRPSEHLQGERLLQPEVVEVQHRDRPLPAGLLGHSAEQLHQRVGRSGVRGRPRQIRQT